MRTNGMISLIKPRCFLFAFVAIGSCPVAVSADPVHGKTFPYVQPNGSSIEVRLFGDEFYHIVESMDGYTLVRDEQTRAACYAELSADGTELLSTGVWAGGAVPTKLSQKKHLRISRESLRKKVAASRALLEEEKPTVLANRNKVAGTGPPINGNVQGITILVDFSDQSATISASAVNDFCNQPGYTGYGNSGSVRDYFYDVSDGNLTYTNYVSTSYYRASQPKSWYDDSSVACCNRARSMVLDALNDLDSRGFDFSQYDSNNDGLVDAVNVFYAGTRNGPWSYGLWPHSGWLSFSADGVSTGRYQITDIGTALRLRTFLHENGHMIGYWPDLYDYGYESTGVGTFCLMGYGTSSTNPGEPSAYMKYIAGWTTTNFLTTPQVGLIAPASINTIFKYDHPTKSNEYYLIENRQKVARDQYLPDAGLAIWHIDTFGSNNNQQMTPSQHYLVTLVQADGLWNLENNNNYGDSTDLWSAPGYVECGPETTPDTSWWDGSESGLDISGISFIGQNMTFSYGLGADCNNNNVPDNEDIAAGTSPDTNSNGIPDECECVAVANTPIAQTPAMSKSRFLSLTPGNAGSQTAIRVTAVSLPAPHDVLDGTSMWIGLPQTVSENSGTSDPAQAPESPTFEAAPLDCDPHYADWGGVGIIHVFGEFIVPDGMYAVASIDASCNPVGNTNYSQPLVITTSRWSDIVKDCTTNPCGPPDGVVGVPTDIVALVDKFKNVGGAPSKARCDLVPETPDFIVNVTEISRAIDAFRGTAYPHPMMAVPCGS